MICFRARLNGAAVATAGIPGRAVLTAIVTWVRRLKNPPTGTETEEKLDLHLGGLDSNGEPWDDARSLNWFNGPLKVGDRLILEILDQEVADPPVHSSPQPRRVRKMTRLKSARHYLKLYRDQVKVLTKRIRDHEKLVANLQRERDAEAPKRTASGVRHPSRQKPSIRRRGQAK